MREIKFRGFDTRINVMYKHIMLGWNGSIEGRLDPNKEGGSVVDITIEHKNGTHPDYIDDYIKVMQFTGLKDKNGKEIYEGDILNTNYQTDVVIPYYVKEALPFITLVNAKDWEYNNGDYYEGGNIQSHNWNKFEVIGNIWENPELLKD
jgi:uncharacterized phage protein (TIGR01671 family)